MRGQIEKSAADVGHEQTEPKRRFARQEEKSNYPAEEGGGFHGGDPTKRPPSLHSGADQKAPERKAFWNFVNTESGKERPLTGRGRLRFLSDSKRQSIGRAVDCQRNNQRRCDFAEMFGRVSVKMAGRARGANVVKIVDNEEKE